MFSASDVSAFLSCPHTLTLAQAEKQGEVRRPLYRNPSLDLLRDLGFEHERRYLRWLSEHEGLQVTEIRTDLGWVESCAQTMEALRRGDAAIYQATFPASPWLGRADILIRVEPESNLGAWSYEAIDTKLACTTKAGAIVQLCFYSDLLAQLQGVEPVSMHVVLGGGIERESFAVKRYIAYYRRLRDEYRGAAADRPVTYPEPVEFCHVCSWDALCDKQRHQDDHLSLVAGISRNQRKALSGLNVTTMTGSPPSRCKSGLRVRE